MNGQNNVRGIIGLLVLLCLCGCKWPIGLDSKGYRELDEIDKRFIENFKAAKDTPIAEVSSVIEAFKDLSETLKPVEVSECLRDAKALLKESIDLQIRGFTEFRDGREEEAGKMLNKSVDIFEEYHEAAYKCV